jgi:chromate transporter
MKNQTKLSTSQVFLAFLKLGLTSFGGPVAHLGYYREEFVVRRRSLSEESYVDLVALCQFLPGPASTQTAIGIGLSQAGLRGGLAAWCGFTLPSALAMILFAYGVTHMEAAARSDWLHGLKVVAVAVVAQAIWGMAKALCPDRPRGSLAIFAALLTLTWPGVTGQLAAIAVGALIGLTLLRYAEPVNHQPQLFRLGRGLSLASLGLFCLLLLLLPLLARDGGHALALFDSFYRTGSLVFGGGHVVLPLLQAEMVGPGWINNDLFLAGYGAAQAVPGPLFTFAAYLGAAGLQTPNGWLGGLLCLLAIFLPSLLLLVGILPFWDVLRRNRRVRAALVGVNAAVVGLLLAAFYNPIWRSGILSAADFMLALAAFGLLVLWKAPPWLVVAATGLGAALVGQFGHF